MKYNLCYYLVQCCESSFHILIIFNQNRHYKKQEVLLCYQYACILGLPKTAKNIYQSANYFLDCLLYKISENNEQCSSQFPRTQVDISILLTLSDHQSKTLKYSVYCHSHRTSENLHIWEWVHFSLFWLNWLIDYQKVAHFLRIN